MHRATGAGTLLKTTVLVNNFSSYQQSSAGEAGVLLLRLLALKKGPYLVATAAVIPWLASLDRLQQKDLIAALDSGQLSYAALDALWPEPLPPESRLWLHPKVTVMQHVARRPAVLQLVTEVAANIRNLKA